LILLLVLSLGAWGQAKRPAAKAKPPAKAPAADAATAWILESLTVKGAKSLPIEQILAVSGLKAGQKAGQAEFEAGRDRLLATGHFETVGYKFEPVPGKMTIAGWFDVVEVAESFPWRLEELPITPEEFTKALQAADPLAGAKLPGTEIMLKKYVQALQSALAEKKVTTPVMALTEPSRSKEMVITFKAKVVLPSIATVDFGGAKALKATDLTRAIANTAIGSPYSETRFREYLANVVKPMYDAVGRLKATFPSVSTKPAPDVRGVKVIVTVDEGPVYKLGEVEVTGAPLSIRQVQKTGDFKTGEPANFTEIEAGVAAILQELKNSGYLKPSYKLERKLNEPEKTVDVAVAITAGEKYTFGKLTVEGLDIHTEPVIRKMWAMKEGDAYNDSYPKIFLEQVRTGGVFDNLGETRPAAKVDDAKRVVDVTLVFKGAGR
jgi:outer membrane protein insertion porin family